MRPANIVLNVYRTFSAGIIKQLSVLTGLKPLIRESGYFCGFLAGKHLCATPVIPVPSPLAILTMAYTERRTHVHRTTYAHTPNDVRTYTEQRTSPFPPDGSAETRFGKPQERCFAISLKRLGTYACSILSTCSFIIYQALFHLYAQRKLYQREKEVKSFHRR